MSTPWIVHQYAPSPNCERLRRVLVRLELPFVVKDYMPFSPEQRAERDAFAQRAGHNQMPVLERDGRYMHDSILTTQALCAEFPDRAHRVFPAAPGVAAQAHAWLLASEASWLRPEREHWTAEYRKTKGEAFARQIVVNDHQRREFHLTAMEAALAEQPFLTGEEYSMGDIGMMSVLNARINLPRMLHSLREAGQEIPFDLVLWPLWDLDGDRYPHVRAWYERCNQPEFTESQVTAGSER